MRFLILLTIFYCVIPASAFSLHFAVKAPLIEHLRSVNDQWKSCMNGSEMNELIAFQSNEERITFHLLMVEKRLRAVESWHLSPEQQAKRNENLSVLHRYAVGGDFPQNTLHAQRQPYFIDFSGTACAVGYLIIESGHENFANEISKKYNYEFIDDLNRFAPQLSLWADENGFTVDELALIQPTYYPKELWLPVLDGIEGPVNSVIYDVYDGSYLVGGNFSDASGIACANVVRWNRQSFEPVGSGLPGEVKRLYSSMSHLYAVGNFSENDIAYELAIWTRDTDEWELLDLIPNQTGETNNFITSQSCWVISGWTLENGEKQHYVARGNANGTGWEIIARMDKPVYTIETTPLDLIAGGEFMVIDDTLEASYLARCTDCMSLQKQAAWTGFSSGVDAPIRILKRIYEAHGTLYAAGNFHDKNGNPVAAVSRLLNGKWQPVIRVINQGGYNMNFINDIEYVTITGEFLIGGEFETGTEMYLWKNLARLDLLSGSIYPKGHFNATINDIQSLEGEIVVGGKFTLSNDYLQVNHIAILNQMKTSIAQDNPEVVSSTVYPNPFADFTRIEVIGTQSPLKENKPELQLYAITGQRMAVTYESDHSGITLYRNDLPAGTYIYNVMVENKKIVIGKLVVW
ncbi:MAG: T9SS type A sorting domain-containing protein [Bacteroidia bacterium]